MYGIDRLITSFLPFFVLGSCDNEANLRQKWFDPAKSVAPAMCQRILKNLEKPVWSKTVRI